jgi:anti-anti-sigma regulatory factor
MEIIVTQEQGRVPITGFEVSGFINLGTASQLEEEARQAYDQGMRYLLIDLSGVGSMSSAGLRSVLVISKMLANDRGDQTTEEGALENETMKSPYLKLLNPQPGIQRVLNIAGFDKFVDIYEDKTQAINSF